MDIGPNILVIGNLNMDFVMQTSRVPLTGENVFGKDYCFVPGGKGGNQAVAAVMLGAKVHFAGKVGNDTYGIQLMKSLAQSGVSTEFLVMDNRLQTGLAAVMLEDNGQSSILIFSGANMDIQEQEIQKAFDNDYDSLLIQFEIPQQIVIEACRIARKRGIPVFVDAGPAQDFPLEEIRGIEILSPNEAEAQAMCGFAVNTGQKAQEAARILQQRSLAHYVVLKLGKRGAMLYSDGKAEFFPALKVQVVDTTAAGDAFTAAMTVEYLRHGDIHKAIRTANIAGAIAVTRLGAMPSLPTLEEIMKIGHN